MKAIKKPCKGTGKAKGFGCGHLQYERVYGLGKRCGCYASWLLSTDEGLKKLKKSKLTGKKRYEKQEKQKRKKEKEKNIDYKKKLQNKVNEIARLIDAGQPCLARGYHAKQMHAGHVYSRGAYPSMRYNLHNIHRQSAQSNHFQNEDGLLREGIIKEYGDDYMEFISGLRKTEALKHPNHYYNRLYRHACKLALELRKSGQVFNKKQRIIKRNEYNIKLNIYSLKYCNYETKINTKRDRKSS